MLPSETRQRVPIPSKQELLSSAIANGGGELQELLRYLSPKERAELDGLLFDQTVPPLEWIQAKIRIPEIRDLIQLVPYQKWCLREALSTDENGLFRYSTIVWSDIKKSIKSTIAAAVALWRARFTPWGQVILVANDLDQADSRVGYYLRRSIELSPELSSYCRIRNYRVDLENHAYIQAVPIDPSGEAGSNADMVVFSELWGSHSVAQTRMWTEMTTPPNKFGKSFRWIETYAGYEGESVLLRQLYDLAVDKESGGEPLEGGEQFSPALHVYRNTAARLFVLWNDTPRLSWQTPEYYAEQSKILQPNEFDRIHHNQWTASVGSFIYAEQWSACRIAELPEITLHEPIIVAMDAAVSGDCFAILALVRILDISYVVECRKWTPPLGGKIDYSAEDGPEAYVAYLCDKYNVLEVDYDEYQLHSTATRLRQELITFFRVFPQGTDRLVADKMLQDAVRARTVLHTGDDDLTAHMLNALAKTEGEKIRLVKKSEKAKIDLAVCLSMAHSRAVELGL